MKIATSLTIPMSLIFGLFVNPAFGASPVHPANDISVKMPTQLKFSNEMIPVTVSPDGKSVAKYYTANLEDGKKIDCEVYLQDQLASTLLGKSKFAALAKHGDFQMPSKVSAQLWKSVAQETLTIAKVNLVMVEGDARKPAGLKPNYLIDVQGSKTVKGLACHLESVVADPTRSNASGSQHQWQQRDFITADMFAKTLGQAK